MTLQVTIILARSKISWRTIQKEETFSWNIAYMSRACMIGVHSARTSLWNHYQPPVQDHIQTTLHYPTTNTSTQRWSKISTRVESHSQMPPSQVVRTPANFHSLKKILWYPAYFKLCISSQSMHFIELFS